ncbi:helix-turn-helix transcriptional regulator [Streptosporangium sp. NPDC002524]|uniref:helix-turn-helix domain-containing protein n=1 Tax=Streptosporangium sp. NPDC002524 TaxID=3154537 RepID=UPI003333F011
MSFGEQLRRYRQQRKISLSGLHAVTYFSKSYLSRVEQGKRNPERVLAELADDALGAGGKLVEAWVNQYGSPLPMLETSTGGRATKRRMFIKSAAIAAGVGLTDGVGQPDQSAAAVARLRDALIPNEPTSGPVLTHASFARAVTRARRDFTAARYADLAGDLAELIPVARDASAPADLATAAQVYHLTTRTLIKLSASPYAWVSAHQGERAAHASGDLQAIGEARRDLASLFHRAMDYGKARDITVSTAELLRPQLPSASASAWGSYGALMSTGAIAAARLEDRDNALGMLEEAEEAARHAPKLVLSAGHVATYKIGVSIVLGDAGTAIEHARDIVPEEIPTLERRASYYTGIAEAYTLWGKTDRAVRALLVAEKIAPSEVRRTGPRQVITDLLHRDRHGKLSGLHALARRSGVTL